MEVKREISDNLLYRKVIFIGFLYLLVFFFNG